MQVTSATDFSTNPELELILCCARTNIDIEKSNLVKELIKRGINWSIATEIALSSRVTPLFYRNIKLINPDGVPDAIVDQLKNDYSKNLHENLHLSRELQSILRLFDAAEISSICYKGPVFAQWLFEDLSLRQSGDLDILVHKNDVVRAKELIFSKGYEIIWPQLPLNSYQEASHLEAKYNYTFFNEINGIVIELHWGITPKYFSFPPDPDWLWKQPVQMSFGSTEVYSFSPEDYLLILCVHGSNHCWIRLSWICDISEIVKKHPTLNWNYIVQEADQFGVKRILLLGLLIAHDFLGTNLPEYILVMIDQDASVRNLEYQIAKKYLENDYIGSSSLEIPLFHLKLRERFTDKIRYCVNMVNPSSRDWAIFPYIPSNSILFFALRPMRLFIEHGVLPISRRLKKLFID
jgi:Uncharacterised nucleotidyltransferase